MFNLTPTPPAQAAHPPEVNPIRVCAKGDLNSFCGWGTRSDGFAPGYCWMLRGCAWVLPPGAPGCCWVLVGAAGVLLGCTWVLLGAAGCFWMALGSRVSFWVIQHVGILTCNGGGLRPLGLGY